MAIAERRRSVTATLAAIVAVAVLARTLFIEWLPGINGDEAWYGVNIHELLAGGTPFRATGIGNPLSPFHSGPLLLLSMMFGPSATVLRVPEVLAGVLAVLWAYPLLRRPLGERAAVITTLLLAVSPTAIAYSRIGWDPSGGPLMILLAMGFAFVDRPFLAIVALAAAWIAHPTNAFAAPMVAAAWVPHGFDRWRASTATTRSRLLWLAIAAGVVAVPAAAWLAMRVAANPATSLPSIAMVIDRVTSPGLWAGRAWGFVNLVSGVSPVLHIAGPLPSDVALFANLVIAVVGVATLIAGWSRLRGHRHARWLLGGIAFAFAGFHVVAMDFALTPTSERYGLFMLVPVLIVMALALDALIARHQTAGRAAVATVATLMTAMTLGGYFVPLWRHGGNAMTTYRTSEVEPKLAAFRFIDADSTGDESVRVIADGWWLYWTLRYFAGADGRIHVDVVPGSNMPGGTHPAGTSPRPTPEPRRTYLVAFEGGAVPDDKREPRFTATDRAGRPVVRVYAADTRP